MKSPPAQLSILRCVVFWKFQLTFWSFAVFTQLLLVGLMGGALAESLTPRLICLRLLTGVILSSISAPILEWLYYLRLSTPKFLISAGLLTLLIFAIGSLAGYQVYTLTTHHKPSREILLPFLLLRLSYYTVWTMLVLRLIGEIHRSRLDQENKQTELSLLRAQVNPHFLFNSLNAIVAESEDPEKVREITSSLSEYLRFSVKQSDEGSVDLRPLGEELTALEDYLRINQIRFEEKLVSMIDAEVAARSQLVPQALVQPLLENAINYGQKTSPFPLVIRITAQVLGPVIQIVVENSGHWIESHSSVSVSTGTGLRNLRRRLELIYGSKASLEIEKASDKVRVRMSLPSSSLEAA